MLTENCRAGHCWSDVHCGGCHDLNVGPDRCQGKPISSQEYRQIKASLSQSNGCLLSLLLALALLLGACTIEGTNPPATTVAIGPTTTVATKPTAPGSTLPHVGKSRRPDPRFTPGEVMPRAKTINDVCRPGSPGRDPQRQVSDSEWRVIAVEYRITVGTRVAEKDHLIAYWAGGASSVNNVWPMLSEADKRRKDGLEVHLYRAVCVDHSLSLETARYRMVHFWLYWGSP